ncbi:MAG: RHS repeat protein, partial [Oscillospiraceae bacterium]|nr:RHS repeat protein [Oscillospiraceae bacterium]
MAKEGRKVGTTELLATYTYDSRGNKISELSAQDAQNGFAFTNQYAYDCYNRVTTQTNALGESVYTEYDMLGNVIKKTDNGGNVTNITYDAFGRVTEQTTPFDTNTLTKTKYTYDFVGNVICEEVWSVSGDSQTLLRKTGYVYDARGNMLQTRSYISQDEYIVTASYTYDSKCQMLSSTSGSYTTQYEYDAYGNVSKITYPNGTFETFVFSPNGNLLSHTDRKGATTQYIYNPLSKPIFVTSGTSYISYTYAKSGVTLSEANNNSVTSYTYDDFGRVQIQTTNNIPVYYSYDLNDNVTSAMLSGETTSYTYDRLNRMTSVVDGNISTQYTYNNLGNRTSTVTSVNGVTTSQTTYVYNLAGLATSLVNRNGDGALLSSFSYTYSADGNILSETDHLGVTTTYTYDMLGRLISEVGAHSSYYSYDISGNRTGVIVDTATVICYNYNANGELVSETSNNGSVSETTAYEYDLNGNLTKKTKGFSVTDYTYNAWNQMVSAGNVTYTYNAQGLRVSKSSSGETDTFTLVGGNVWSDSESKYLRGIELIASDTQIY